MKRIVREFIFTPEQQEHVRELARALSLTETTAGILYARGVDTERKMREFLHTSRKNLLSPFLMKGMREAKELLTRAKEEEWRVAVFGDYDADGIGACAILSRALRSFGIEPYLYVPERADGYGMSVAAIDAIFDEFLPDLIVTVDCGISNRREVEYIKEQGAYCIVTDHHELPEELPDCIVVNPKLHDDYPYDNLCGAGVAYKLAAALIGEEADSLLDFAALSTVADSVPLVGENRIIVAEGLKLYEKSPRPALAALLGKTGEVTAQTLAFTLAPRVNAAGRMGDARAALKLFTSEDEGEIFELAAKLNAYNSERQKYCDELYAQASAEIGAQGAYGNVVMLAGEDWNAGFVGIVAARIAEEFSRPALLFVRRGDKLKGSARSIERVNIFDALRGCSAYIEEFGGHAQAAGVNLDEKNFEALKAALDEYIGSRYSREDFEAELVVSGEAEEDFRRIAHELLLLEPCGVGNRRPLFSVRAGKVAAAPLKPLSPHVGLNAGGMDLVYFNGEKDLGLLNCDLEKQIVFEYNVSTFRGKESVKGFVRYISADALTGKEIELEGFARKLASFREPCAAAHMSAGELNAFIAKKREECAYGLVAVVYDRAVLKDFPALSGLPAEALALSSSNNANLILFAPEEGCDLTSFRDVAVLDGAASVVGKNVCAAPEVRSAAYDKVDCSREGLLATFAALRKAEGRETGSTLCGAVRELCLADPPEHVLFALSVFEELGLISLARGRLEIARGKHTELTESKIYNAVRRVKGEG